MIIYFLDFLPWWCLDFRWGLFLRPLLDLRFAALRDFICLFILWSFFLAEPRAPARPHNSPASRRAGLTRFDFLGDRCDLAIFDYVLNSSSEIMTARLMRCIESKFILSGSNLHSEGGVDILAYRLSQCCFVVGFTARHSLFCVCIGCPCAGALRSTRISLGSIASHKTHSS